MNHLIKSKLLDRTLTFSIPGKSYVYVDLNDKSGSLGNQICHNGKLTGECITFSGNNKEEFKKLCTNWYRNYIRRNNK